MRVSILGFALVLALVAVGALAAPAHASPAAPVARLAVSADVAVAAYPRPYGYRWVGGYYTTEYQWVWVEGSVHHVNAFGRVVRNPGHYELLPHRVWVPYRVVYGRTYARPAGDGQFHWSGTRIY